MQEIIQAIQEHALPRPYDWLVLTVAGIALVVSGLAAYFSYRLNKKQSEILEQQNRISLFDKRYELFKKIEQLDINFRVMLSDIHFDSHISFYNAEESRRFFCIYAFRRLLSFEPEFIADKVIPISPHRIYDVVENFIVELEKAAFIFELDNEQQQKYQVTLGIILRIVHQMTGGPQMGIVEKKEVIYKVSYKDLKPLKELSFFVDIFKNQLYVNKPKDTLCTPNPTSSRP